MKVHKWSIPQRLLWAYGYNLVPPIARDRMGPINAVLEGAYREPGLAAFAWEGRLINGDDITHILVVSDRPEQDLEVNHLLEAELNRLHAPFTITRALAIGGDSGSGRLPEPLGNA